MTVWVVIRYWTQSFENESCWDDGYYDDYYETEVSGEELIGIYASEELAKQVKEKEEEHSSYIYDRVEYFPYEVVDNLKKDLN